MCWDKVRDEMGSCYMQRVLISRDDAPSTLLEGSRIFKALKTGTTLTEITLSGTRLHSTILTRDVFHRMLSKDKEFLNPPNAANVSAVMRARGLTAASYFKNSRLYLHETLGKVI